MVDPNVIAIIKQYIDELIKYNIVVNKAILFGSHTRDEATNESDIDLLIVSTLFDIDRDKYLGILWKLTKLSDYRIEPFAVGVKRFEEDKFSPIIQIAKKEGIEIHF